MRGTSQVGRRAVLALVAAAQVASLVLLADPAAAKAGTATVPLSRDLAAYASTRRSTASVAVWDELTGRQYAYRAASSYDNASIVKVNILETVLWRAQRAGRQLTSWEQSRAVPMIRNSDNDAATALWNHVGGASGVAAYDRVLGMTHTTFDRQGHWGLTTSTVGDQLLLLRAMGVGAGPLNAYSRRYVQTQMAHVRSDQHWGVSSGPAVGVELKNGWLPRASHGWRINSIGHVSAAGRRYTIAVLTTDEPSMSYGVATVEGLSRIVYRDLAPQH